MIDLSDYCAAIFDMDGLLIDSEPHWQDAEIAVYAACNVPVTRDLCLATAGVATGKAAGMTVIAVPSIFEADEPGIRQADHILESLLAFGRIFSAA